MTHKCSRYLAGVVAADKTEARAAATTAADPLRWPAYIRAVESLLSVCDAAPNIPMPGDDGVVRRVVPVDEIHHVLEAALAPGYRSTVVIPLDGLARKIRQVLDDAMSPDGQYRDDLAEAVVHMLLAWQEVP